MSRFLTDKNGQLKIEIPSVAMMTNFGFGPVAALVNQTGDLLDSA